MKSCSVETFCNFSSVREFFPFWLHGGVPGNIHDNLTRIRRALEETAVPPYAAMERALRNAGYDVSRVTLKKWIERQVKNPGARSRQDGEEVDYPSAIELLVRLIETGKIEGITARKSNDSLGFYVKTIYMKGADGKETNEPLHVLMPDSGEDPGDIWGWRVRDDAMRDRKHSGQPGRDIKEGDLLVFHEREAKPGNVVQVKHGERFHVRTLRGPAANRIYVASNDEYSAIPEEAEVTGVAFMHIFNGPEDSRIYAVFPKGIKIP